MKNEERSFGSHNRKILPREAAALLLLSMWQIPRRPVLPMPCRLLPPYRRGTAIRHNRIG